jgi:ATP-dependent DNA helicase RecQ
LRALAQRRPSQMNDLEGVAGIGQKKREAYGAEVLRVVAPFLS